MVCLFPKAARTKHRKLGMLIILLFWRSSV